LNRLPEVKAFISVEIPKYTGVSVKYIPGMDPTMSFKNGNGDEMERVSIASMKTADIHTLLQSKGFTMNSVDAIPNTPVKLNAAVDSNNNHDVNTVKPNTAVDANNHIIRENTPSEANAPSNRHRHIPPSPSDEPERPL